MIVPWRESINVEMQTNALMNLKDILSKPQVNEAWLMKRRRGEKFLPQLY